MNAENGTAAAAEPVVDNRLPVSLDLDTLERDGGRPGPFVFKHEGDIFQMMDPEETDWQDLLSGLRNPALFIRFTMSIEDQKRFFNLRVPAWKMNRVMQAYQKHYGIPDLGNASALLT